MRPMIIMRALILIEARDPPPHFILNKPPHAAELSQAVKIADERHIRIGRLIERALRFKMLLRRGKERRVGPDRHPAERSPRRPDAKIDSPRAIMVDLGEEIISIIDAAQKEDRHIA